MESMARGKQPERGSIMSNNQGVKMMVNQVRKWKLFAQTASVFALAISFAAAPVLRAQEQQQRQDQNEPPDQHEQQDPRNVPFRPFGPGPGGYAQGAAPAYQPPPPALTLREGTVISVRTAQWLSSDRNHTGDLFNAELTQPVIVDGWVVARPGQTVIGRVGVAEKAKSGGGNSRLGVELSQLVLVDGQQLPVRTQLMQSTGRSNVGQAAGVGVATTITGAAIGGAVHGGEGAGIGAGIGAMAGLIGVLLTPGKPTVIPAEAQLNFQLVSPVTISTEHSSQAFQPVGPDDFAAQNYDRYQNGPRTRVGPPGPPPGGYPPAYYAPYYGSYYYGGWGYPGWGYPGWGYYYGPSIGFGFYGGRFGGYRGRFRR